MLDTITEVSQQADTHKTDVSEGKDPFAAILNAGHQVDITEPLQHSEAIATEPPQFSPENVTSSMQQMQLLRDEIEKQQAPKGVFPQANIGAIPSKTSTLDAGGLSDPHTLRESFIPSHGEKKSSSLRAKNLLSELKLEKAGTFIKTVLEIPGKAIKFIGKNLMKFWTSGDSPRTPVSSPPELPQGV